MPNLLELTHFLDNYLNVKKTPDYPTAYNGLQAGEEKPIKTVAGAVDASYNSIKEAVDKGVDLLIVHHGLYWQGVEMLTKAWRKKCKLILESNIAIYSSHIPLDIHPEVGNSPLLAKHLGLKNITPCHPWKGINLAVKGSYGKTRDQLAEDLTRITGAPPTTCLAGPDTIDELVVITGGAGSEIAKIHDQGYSHYLSGEGSHWIMPYAEENELNLFLAGHYRTETFGVKAVCSLLNERFDLQTINLSHAKNVL